MRYWVWQKKILFQTISFKSQSVRRKIPTKTFKFSSENQKPSHLVSNHKLLWWQSISLSLFTTLVVSLIFIQWNLSLMKFPHHSLPIYCARISHWCHKHIHFKRYVLSRWNKCLHCTQKNKNFQSHKIDCKLSPGSVMCISKTIKFYNVTTFNASFSISPTHPFIT